MLELFTPNFSEKWNPYQPWNVDTDHEEFDLAPHDYWRKGVDPTEWKMDHHLDTESRKICIDNCALWVYHCERRGDAQGLVEIMPVLHDMDLTLMTFCDQFGDLREHLEDLHDRVSIDRDAGMWLRTWVHSIKVSVCSLSDLPPMSEEFAAECVRRAEEKIFGKLSQEK